MYQAYANKVGLLSQMFTKYKTACFDLIEYIVYDECMSSEYFDINKIDSICSHIALNNTTSTIVADWLQVFCFEIITTVPNCIDVFGYAKFNFFYNYAKI